MAVVDQSSEMPTKLISVSANSLGIWQYHIYIHELVVEARQLASVAQNFGSSSALRNRMAAGSIPTRDVLKVAIFRAVPG